MPSWIIIFSREGKMPGILGPYITRLRAQSVQDKLNDADSVIIDTTAHDRATAKQEIRKKLILEHGYEEGSRNIKNLDGR